MSHPSVLVRRLPVFPAKGKGVKKYQHNKSVANGCTNFMINLSNSFMKSINTTSILTFISIIFTCTYDSRFLIAWTIFFIKLCHSMTAYNKIYVSVLKNNTNYEATIIASFSNDRFRRDIENLPRFLQVGLPPLTHGDPHTGRSETWYVRK